ncbi:MAG TPA: DUF2017 family protein [Actinomycetota bacterium]
MRRSPFRPGDGGAIEAELPEPAAETLEHLAGELIEALGSPQDPGLRRLFPPAYATDERAQAEYESLTRDELTDGKRIAAQRVIDSVEAGARRGGTWRAQLDAEASSAWLAVLNDARLVLGTRLDVTDETYDAELAEDDPALPAHNLYLYLGALEEALVDALAEQLDTDGR